MISLVIKAWQGNGIEVAPCMGLQGPLSMFTFIRNYKRHDLMSGNRLGNEMYSNMLAVHTFFLPSSSVVHSHFHLGLSPKALSDFPFFFCLFCQLLSLTLPPDTQLVRPANWAGKWHGHRQNNSRWLWCASPCMYVLWDGGNLFALKAWNLRRASRVLNSLSSRPESMSKHIKIS